MKALTIWQPWAALIMLGAKPYEFRRWPAPAALVGQRIVIHAGARAVKSGEVADLIVRLKYQKGAGTGLNEKALPFLERVRAGDAHPMLAAGIGTAVLGNPRRCTELFIGQVADSDRIDERRRCGGAGGRDLGRALVPDRDRARAAEGGRCRLALPELQARFRAECERRWVG